MKAELTFIKKDGTIFPVEVSSTVFTDPEGEKRTAVFVHDITNRKKSESDLLASENRFRVLADNALVGIYILKEGKYTYINNAMAKIFGYSRDEMIGMAPNQIVHESNHSMVADYIKKRIDGEENSLHYEVKGRHKNGSILDLEVFGSRTEMNNKIALIGTLIDITERKQIEKELIESQEQLKLFIKHSPVALAMFDTNMRYIATSCRWITDYNLAGQNVIGRTHYEVFPEIPQRWKDVHLRCLQGAIEMCKEDSFTRADGNTEWLNWEIRPWRKATGEIGGIIMFTEIITEHKKSAELIRYQFENSPDIIAILDKNLTIQSINKAFQGSDLKVADMIGRNTIDLLPEEIRQIITEKANRCLATGEPQEVETMAMFSNNRQKWIRARFVPININDVVPTHIVNIVTDITERKIAENALSKSNEQYSQLFDQMLNGLMVCEVIYDDNGQPIDHFFVHGNPACEKLTGLSVKEQKGRTSKDFAIGWPPDVVQTLYKVAMTGEPIQYERFNETLGRTYETRVFSPRKGQFAHIFTDITESKKEKEELLKFKKAIISSGEIIFLTDKEGVFTYVNPAFTVNYGYSSEEVVGKLTPRILKGGLRNQNQYRSFWENLLMGNNQKAEFINKRKDGTLIVTEATASAIYDENKKIVGFVGVQRDITERKKLEEQLELAGSIIDSTDDAIISKTPEGIVTSWNNGAEKILGYFAEEIIGRHISMIIPTELLEEEEEIMRKVHAGLSLDHYETKRIKKDGSVIEVSITISPIKDSPGNIVGSSKIMRDITERKKAEERIKQSEANYRQLFDLSPVPMWLIDDETYKFIQVNNACITNYGYTQQEFAAMTLGDIIPKDNKMDIKDIVTNKNHPYRYFMNGHMHVKKSGELIDVDMSGIQVVLDGKKRILGIGIDVTEKNLYEQKLARAAIKVQEEERYEIGGELHDNVCQILAASLMYLGMTKKSVTAETKEYFDQTHQYITLASDEIRNLSHRLAPAFFGNATLEIAFQQLLKSFNIEDNYEITVEFDNASKSYPVSRDLQLNLYRILQEQLRNILKHSKATSIEVEVTLNDYTLQMSIADNGIGFDAKNSTGGIGLANMKRRVRLFSGGFAIESEPGKGCKVIVEVPLSGND
ncbi:MAG: PAS domain S-box protein [Bacteroidota bacterium]|nr:PAS domain S-box protein [Bacteroidota bacterium]